MIECPVQPRLRDRHEYDRSRADVRPFRLPNPGEISNAARIAKRIEVRVGFAPNGVGMAASPPIRGSNSRIVAGDHLLIFGPLTSQNNTSQMERETWTKCTDMSVPRSSMLTSLTRDNSLCGQVDNRQLCSRRHLY